MSQELLTQHREYGEYQHKMRQPVAVEDLERLVAHPMVPVRPSRPNGPLIAIAVLVGVLLLVGGAAFLFSGSGEEQPADSVVPTTPPESAPTTAVDSSPTASATVPDEETVIAGLSVPVSVVGTAVTPSVIGDLEWTVIEIDAPLSPTGFVATPFGFGMVSRDGSQLLLSEKGASWTSIPSPITRHVALEGTGDGYFEGVVLWGGIEGGYTLSVVEYQTVCLTLDPAAGNCEDSDTTETVTDQWYSTDFSEWEEIQAPDESRPSFGSARVESDVLTNPPPQGPRRGYLSEVDAGLVWGQGFEQQDIWASPDGENWEKVDLSPLPSYQLFNMMFAVEAFGVPVTTFDESMILELLQQSVEESPEPDNSNLGIEDYRTAIQGNLRGIAVYYRWLEKPTCSQDDNTCEYIPVTPEWPTWVWIAELP